ncbi:hypothetical protein LguiB_031482 [Lonicera macranthoides]
MPRWIRVDHSERDDQRMSGPSDARAANGNGRFASYGERERMSAAITLLDGAIFCGQLEDISASANEILNMLKKARMTEPKKDKAKARCQDRRIVANNSSFTNLSVGDVPFELKPIGKTIIYETHTNFNSCKVGSGGDSKRWLKEEKDGGDINGMEKKVGDVVVEARRWWGSPKFPKEDEMGPLKSGDVYWYDGGVEDLKLP